MDELIMMVMLKKKKVMALIMMAMESSTNKMVLNMGWVSMKTVMETSFTRM